MNPEIEHSGLRPRWLYGLAAAAIALALLAFVALALIVMFLHAAGNAMAGM